ncbi:MAG: phosphoribosyltransferase family protein [Thaumarchaeota archaeon]|nr:phosphoribosyltransferase family protein [Nitrososphaerota archaeon]
MRYAARSYADVGEIMHAVMTEVLADGWEPDVIVSVERGGRVPARMALAHANTTCKTPAEMARVKASKYGDSGNVLHAVRVGEIRVPRKGAHRMLIVDDVLETGDTMRAVVRELGRYTSDIRVAAAFKKSSYTNRDVMGYAAYCGEEVGDDVWIVPEWEDDEYRKAGGGVHATGPAGPVSGHAMGRRGAGDDNNGRTGSP